MKSQGMKHLCMFFDADRIWDEDQPQISSIAFSPDEKYLAAPGIENALNLWSLKPEDIKNPEEPKPPPPPSDAERPIFTISSDVAMEKCAISSDGKYFALVATNQPEINKEEERQMLEDMMAAMEAERGNFNYGTERKKIEKQYEIRLYSFDDYKLIQTFPLKLEKYNYLYAMKFHPEGNTIALCLGQAIHFLSLDSGEIKKLDALGISRGFAFSPDGKHIATVSPKKKISVWRVSDFSLVRVFDTPCYEYTELLLFTNDSKSLVFQATEKTIECRSIETGNLEKTIEYQFSWRHNEAALSSDNSIFVSYSDERIFIYSFKTGELLRTIEAESGYIHHIRITPDNKRMLVNGEWNYAQLHVWSLETGVMLNLYEASEHYLNGMEITPDGKYVLTVSGDASIWEL